ncbi:MAG: hypothetical protein EBR82_09790 [Caulobacteraceae bacterium]|nr:hypothetical protein [Caulobacteraceae bacterium]
MILVPIRTVPGLNAREHFRVRAKRVKAEREATAYVLAGKPKPPIPCSVRLTRVSPRGVADDDNLVGAMKAIRDQIAQWLGVDDKHRNQVRYVYAQKRGAWGVEIEWGEPVAGAQFELLGETV